MGLVKLLLMPLKYMYSRYQIIAHNHADKILVPFRNQGSYKVLWNVNMR